MECRGVLFRCEIARDLSVAAGSPCADRRDFSPHAALKGRALRRERQVEAEFEILDVALDLRAHPCREPVPRCKRFARFRQERDLRERIAFCADSKQREWRRQFRLIGCARGARAVHRARTGSRPARIRMSWAATTTANTPRPTISAARLAYTPPT